MDEFERAIVEFDVDAPPEGVSALGHRTALAALQGMRDELAAQLSVFEDLERRGIEAVRFQRLADLPRALVETRIARGMTQKDIADKMEIPSQQVQRWEANDYDRTGLAFVLEVGEILNIDEVLRRNRLASPAVDVPATFPLELQDQAASGWFVGGGFINTVEVARHFTACVKSGSKETLGHASISLGAQDVSTPLNSLFQGQHRLAKSIAV